jgi:hypothetical protein
MPVLRDASVSLTRHIASVTPVANRQACRTGGAQRLICLSIFRKCRSRTSLGLVGSLGSF